MSLKVQNDMMKLATDHIVGDESTLTVARNDMKEPAIDRTEGDAAIDGDASKSIEAWNDKRKPATDHTPCKKCRLRLYRGAAEYASTAACFCVDKAANAKTANKRQRVHQRLRPQRCGQPRSTATPHLELAQKPLELGIRPNTRWMQPSVARSPDSSRHGRPQPNEQGRALL